jgi:roadblock/LC7 domain-containing protein
MTEAPPVTQDPQPAARLPGNITAAAVILLIFGALGGVSTMLALLAVLLAGTRRFVPFGDPGMMGGQWVTDGGHAAGMLVVFMVLLALLGAALTGAHVAAGWAILQRHRWARVLGLVVSGAALVVLVIGLASMFVWAMVDQPPGFVDYGRRMGDYYHSMMGPMLAFGTIITLGLIAAYGFVLWVLARHGDALDQGPRSTGS